MLYICTFTYMIYVHVYIYMLQAYLHIHTHINTQRHTHTHTHTEYTHRSGYLNLEEILKISGEKKTGDASIHTGVGISSWWKF